MVTHEGVDEAAEAIGVAGTDRRLRAMVERVTRRKPQTVQLIMVVVEPLHDGAQLPCLGGAFEPLAHTREQVALLIGLMARGGFLEVAPQVLRGHARRLAGPMPAPVLGQPVQQLRGPLPAIMAGDPERQRRFKAGRRPAVVDAVHGSGSRARPDCIAGPASVTFP